MICKTCGYEAQKNFYICPSCGGEDIVTQNVDTEANQNKYYQKNQSNPSQYQTPFTQPNQQSNQYGNPVNQYGHNDSTPVNQYGNPANQYNNNYSAPANQYGNPVNNYINPANQYNDIPNDYQEQHKPIKPSYNPLQMAHYFEGGGNSFKVTDNEIKISRYLNGGKFIFLPRILSCTLSILGSVGAFCAMYFIPSIGNMIKNIFNSGDYFWCGIVFFVIISLLVFPFLMTAIAKFATITVNSSGITVKTLIGKKFIPKEDIYYCDYQSVTRWESRTVYKSPYIGARRIRTSELYQELYQDVFIIAKGKKDKCDEIDTGLCYKLSEPVTYLRDEFNRYLGIEITGI